jgi:hypothetical protein
VIQSPWGPPDPDYDAPNWVDRLPIRKSYRSEDLFLIPLNFQSSVPHDFGNGSGSLVPSGFFLFASKTKTILVQWSWMANVS